MIITQTRKLPKILSFYLWRLDHNSAMGKHQAINKRLGKTQIILRKTINLGPKILQGDYLLSPKYHQGHIYFLFTV